MTVTQILVKTVEPVRMEFTATLVIALLATQETIAKQVILACILVVLFTMNAVPYKVLLLIEFEISLF